MKAGYGRTWSGAGRLWIGSVFAAACLAMIATGCGTASRRDAVPARMSPEEFRQRCAEHAAHRVALLGSIETLDEPRLAMLARDVEEDIAVAATIALGRDRDRRSAEAIEALCGQVHDPRVAVRRVAFLSLFNLVLNQPGDFDEEHVVPAVLKGLRDRDLGVSQLALVPTEYMADPAVLAEMLEVMASPFTHVSMRSHLAWAAGEQRQPYALYAVPELLKCLDVPGYFFIYYHAAESLRSISGVDLDRPARPARWEDYRTLYGSDEWRARTKDFYARWWADAGRSLLDDPLADCPGSDDAQVRDLVERMRSNDWADRQRATRQLVEQHAQVRAVLEHLSRARDARLALEAHKGLMLLEGQPLHQRRHRLDVLRPVVAAGQPVRTAEPSGAAYADVPFEFEVGIAGAPHVVDLDGDGVSEFLMVGSSGAGDQRQPAMGAYSHTGELLWKVHLPGWGSAIPGRPVGEFLVNGQPQRCIVGMLADGTVHLWSARDGQRVASAGPFRMHDGRLFDREPIENAHRATVSLANLTGAGRWNLIIAKGRSAIALDRDLTPCWNLSVEGAFSHHQMDVADVDGDGRDEIFLGGTAIAPDGRVLHTMTAGAHIDDCASADFLPDRPGKEILYAQERGADAVLLCDTRGLIWHEASGEEPQVLVAGEYDPASPGAEAYCPARGGRRPFIIGGTGQILLGFGDATRAGAGAPYPLGWDSHLLGTGQEEAKSDLGLVYGSGDWDGDGVDELLVHRARGVELVSPVTWQVVLSTGGIAGNTLLTQVCGDGRPELVISLGNRLIIWGHPDEGAGRGR